MARVYPSGTASQPTGVAAARSLSSLSEVRTLGGHRRFRAAEVRRFLDELGDVTV